MLRGLHLRLVLHLRVCVQTRKSYLLTINVTTVTFTVGVTFTGITLVQYTQSIHVHFCNAVNSFGAQTSPH